MIQYYCSFCNTLVLVVPSNSAKKEESVLTTTSTSHECSIMLTTLRANKMSIQVLDNLCSSLDTLKTFQALLLKNEHVQVLTFCQEKPYLLYCVNCIEYLETTLKELINAVTFETGKFHQCIDLFHRKQSNPDTVESLNEDVSSDVVLKDSSLNSLSANSPEKKDHFQTSPQKETEESRLLNVTSGIQNQTAISSVLYEPPYFFIDCSDEDSALKNQLASLRSEHKHLRRLEKKLQHRFVGLQSFLKDAYMIEGMLQAQATWNCTLLGQLTNVNVIHDAFCIDVDGYYATINGMKLGKRPNDQVSWDEVNAALGQVGLLLDCLIQSLLRMCNSFIPSSSTNESETDKTYQHYRSQTEKTSHVSETSSSITKPSNELISVVPQMNALLNYRIIPRGNYTVILSKADDTLLELYYAGAGITKYFATRRFEQAIGIITQLVTDITGLAAYVHAKLEATTIVTQFTPPFEMNGFSVGGASLRLSGVSGSDEWTTALKYFLSNLKWLIGVVSELLQMASRSKA